ncbi:MAG TPA: hypothetical protein VGO22_05720 [Pseudorhizobium sp.]|jgi:hypothetical protein|nr:hypothetical protein [Pseudorhizobium sp.]
MADEKKSTKVFIRDSYRPEVEQKSYRPSSDPKTSYTPTTSQGDTTPPMPKKK